MVAFNEKYQEVVKQLDAGVSKNELMRSYHCTIIELDDENYMTNLYRAIGQQDAVFDYMKGNVLLGKIIFPHMESKFGQLKATIMRTLIGCLVGVLAVVDVFCLSLYVKILSPFHRLKEFAGNVALGNLDAPLHMDKGNYFGAFTESFDIMREELKAAREGEYQANLSKKELVASLSHDIKTPVATIKAICEILEIKLRDNENIGKIQIIGQKVDVIEHLVNNLFHATLEEMQSLKVTPGEESSMILLEMLEEMNHYGRISFVNELPGCLLYCDKLRLHQVIENIISNSYKYADTDIEVRFEEKERSIQVEIRDFGQALEDVDLLLVCEKYYRGGNAAKKNGAGLGLYLAKTFMERMCGEMTCTKDHGFVVTLEIAKVTEELRNG